MHKPDHPQFENVEGPACCDCGEPSTSRRAFLWAGAGVALAGCASTKPTSSLPGPVWNQTVLTPAPTPVKPDEPPAKPESPGSMPSTVLARTQWSQSGPAFALMNRMLPVQYITVHHDGMDPFYGNDAASAAARLELIRRAHRNKGWGDIGYHFAVDRGGRVWECRPIGWQGAHVKDRNEGNIGVVTLGNFDQQSPTQAQLSALNRHVSWLMQNYRVPVKKVYTHQEWPGAQTACPGTNLERYMQAVRRSGQIG